MKHLIATILSVSVASVTTACAAPFAIDTPSGMVALEESQWSNYDYRATTPSGVVVAARVIRQGEGRETPAGDLSFWSDAIQLRMRTSSGYALLSEEPFATRDGSDGVRLRFGRDQQSTPYRYDVVLIVTGRYVHVVEAGGRADLADEASDLIEEAIASYEVRR